MSKSVYEKTTPIWLTIVLYISTLTIGVYIGSPLAVSYYDLGSPTEVDQLFFLTTLIFSYLLIPLCILCACGLMLVRKKQRKILNALYVFLCIIFIPIIFYGLAISDYYG